MTLKFQYKHEVVSVVQLLRGDTGSLRVPTTTRAPRRPGLDRRVGEGVKTETPTDGEGVKTDLVSTLSTTATCVISAFKEGDPDTFPKDLPAYTLLKPRPQLTTYGNSDVVPKSTQRSDGDSSCSVSQFRL